MKNEPAFPTYFTGEHALSMTLRDYFAAKAMVGLMGTERANQYIDEGGLEMDYEEEGSVGTLFVHTDQMAEEAYMIADMMLKARGE
jgi:hypothetical protein